METRNSALMIFDHKPIQDDIRGYSEVIYYPKTHPSGGGPIEFEIPGNAEEYIDVNNTRIHIRLKVVKGDGKDIAAADKVALTNLPIASLFSDVTLTLHNTQVDGGQTAYPYIAYFNTLLNMHPAAKKTHLRASGWYMDEAEKFDDDTGKGFTARKNLLGASDTIELYGPLYLDFFRQERYLISNVPINLKFLRSKPEFALIGHNNASKSFKIEIKEMRLHTRQMLMNPSVISGHMKGMKTQHAHYPIGFNDFDTFTIPKDHVTYVKDRLYATNSPRLLLVALVDNTAFNGTIDKNPFNFQHFDLNYLSLLKNGKPFPGEPFKPNFDGDRCLREYVHTMETLGYFNTDDTNGLTYQDFVGGSAIYAFDLTDDNTLHSAHKQVDKGATLRLELKFAKPLPSTVSVILLALCDSFIDIGAQQNVLIGHKR